MTASVSPVQRLQNGASTTPHDGDNGKGYLCVAVAPLLSLYQNCHSLQSITNFQRALSYDRVNNLSQQDNMLIYVLMVVKSDLCQPMHLNMLASHSEDNQKSSSINESAFLNEQNIMIPLEEV